MRYVKRKIFIFVLLAAALAFVSVVHVKTYAPYEMQVAADKSFTMHVPGEYKNFDDADYVRQGYNISGDTVMGMGIEHDRGIIVIRSVLDDRYQNISNEEFLDEVIAQSQVGQNTGALEKIIANDIVFLKNNNHPGYDSVYMTYHNSSIYIFAFSVIQRESQERFDEEVYQMLNSLVFNPDPAV